MLRRLGSSWEFGALLKGLTSVVVLKVERTHVIHSPHQQFLPDTRFEPRISGYKSNALFIRPRLPLPRQSTQHKLHECGNGQKHEAQHKLKSRVLRSRISEAELSSCLHSIRTNLPSHREHAIMQDTNAHFTRSQLDSTKSARFVKSNVLIRQNS